jgi:glycosyltransferase involved in cell wall biosynthesis
VTSPPRISILLPVRDAAATLPEALESIGEQTFTDWELIAVDDGSSDRSGDVLARAGARDGRIRLLRQSAQGIVPALEAARAHARGELLARMDADDRSHPHRLEAQLQLLERRRDLVGCGGHVRYVPRDRLSDGILRYEAWLNGITAPDEVDRELWVECPLAHPTFCLRSDSVARVGGYRQCGWPEDYDLLLRLRLEEGPLGVVPETVLDWRDSPDRLSRTAPAYSARAFRRVRLHFLARSLLRGRSGLLVWGAGPTGKVLAREALSMEIPVRAFVDLDPRKLGQEVHGAPVIPPGEIGAFRDALGVAAVVQPGARAEIRGAFIEAGWVEGRDFVAMA